MSALPPKADITEGYEKCPLMTQSGQKRLVEKSLVIDISFEGGVNSYDGLHN